MKVLCVCLHCGKQFQGGIRALYCSRKHQQAAHYALKTKHYHIPKHGAFGPFPSDGICLDVVLLFFSGFSVEDIHDTPGFDFLSIRSISFILEWYKSSSA